MTFDEEWFREMSQPAERLRDVLEKGLEAHDEVFISFEVDESSAMLNMMSDQDAGDIKDIIEDSFNRVIPRFEEADFYIETDLLSLIDDFDDF
jgi:hypothetical protein